MPTPEPRALRIGLCRTPYWSRIEPGGEAASATAAERPTRAGVAVEELVLPDAVGGLFEAQDTIMFGEGQAAFLDEFLIQGPRPGQDFIDRAENAKGITSERMIAAHDLAAGCRRGFAGLFALQDRRRR